MAWAVSVDRPADFLLAARLMESDCHSFAAGLIWVDRLGVRKEVDW